MVGKLKQNDIKGAAKSQIDLAMGTVGLFGLPGFVISGCYFLVDQTVGWNWLTDNVGISDERAKQIWADHYSGKTQSKVLNR